MSMCFAISDADWELTKDVLNLVFSGFSAAATVVAASVALIFGWKGLNAWRKQGRATTDHELSRKLIVALRVHQDELIKNWTYAASAVSRIENNSWIGDGGRDNYWVGIYERKLKGAK